jgi:catechol-2,3-dioxygenase
MPIRLQNVVLPSLRFEEAKAFYQDVLGLDVRAEGPGFCFLRLGGTNIAIHQVDADEASRLRDSGKAVT